LLLIAGLNSLEKVNARVAVAVVATACLAGMAVGSALTFAFLSSQRAIPSTGVVLAVNVGVFSDAGCTLNLTSIDWGSVNPGESVSRTIYVKDRGNAPIPLGMATGGWNPAVVEDQLAISWNREGSSLGPGESAAATLTLAVSASVHDVASFSANIIITGSG
jgi:hypothetical protein